MSDLQVGDQIWMVSFEVENDFFLLSKQTIVELSDQHIECEDEFNTFHVAYEDAYKSEAEALDVMIEKLQQLRQSI